MNGWSLLVVSMVFLSMAATCAADPARVGPAKPKQ